MDVRDFPYKPEHGTPYEARLLDTPSDTWANTILWKLAVATGDARRGYGSAIVNPDDLIDKVMDIIEQWRLEHG